MLYLKISVRYLKISGLKISVDSLKIAGLKIIARVCACVYACMTEENRTHDQDHRTHQRNTGPPAKRKILHIYV